MAEIQLQSHNPLGFGFDKPVLDRENSEPSKRIIPSMEVVVVPHKQIKTPKRCANSRSSIHGGFSFYPPPHMSSPSLSSTHHQQIHRQPPLLPLPIHHHSLPSPIRDFSSSPPKPAQKVLKSRDQSLTPKKSKSPGRKKDPNPYLKSSTSPASNGLINVSTAYMDLSSVLPPLPSSLSFIENDFSNVNMKEFEKFSGSLFTISPHPSSLPLPKFSIRSKVKCKVEAGGIDAGATDNLRRLLRLR